MSEAALRRGEHERRHYRRAKLFMSEPRSLIGAKATCVTRSNSTSMCSGNTRHRRGAEFVAHDSWLRFGSLNHASGSAINPQSPMGSAANSLNLLQLSGPQRRFAANAQHIANRLRSRLRSQGPLETSWVRRRPVFLYRKINLMCWPRNLLITPRLDGELPDIRRERLNDSRREIRSVCR
jgi:hypothetical protein